MEPSDYAAWNTPLYEWETVGAFTEQPHWLDGVHSVRLANGNHLDVLLHSNPLSTTRPESVAVFFSGALPNRAGKYGPYFSGARMARELDVPFMAFSDPSLNLEGNFPLGWYAGSQNDGCQDAISQILENAVVRSQRHLLLVGGSGGGFASLYYAHRVGARASAFVWNPQTSIIDYEVSAVRQYFDVAVPGNKFEYGKDSSKAEVIAELTKLGITSVLPRSNAGRILYLQNSSDWHVAKHLKPYLERNDYIYRGNGFYANDSGHSVIISSYGIGHAVPPTELIHASIKKMLAPGRSTRAIYNELIDSSLLRSDFHTLPRDMRGEWEALTNPLSLNVENVSGNLIASINWGALRAGVGGIKVAFNAFDETSVIQATAKSSDYSLVISSPENTVRVEATFFDGFDHCLGAVSSRVPGLPKLFPEDPLNVAHQSPTRSLSAPSDAPEEASAADPKRVFIYGSCVSRDAFEENDAPVLVDYLARSCLGSAFSASSNRLADISLESNPSAFQRRMVAVDLSKDLGPLLVSSVFDLLLVDFIDERLQLIRTPVGYDTYSPELARTGVKVDTESLVAPGSDEYMNAFKSGWEKLVTLVGANKIVINRVFWATHDEAGASLDERDNIAHNNDILIRLYEYAAATPGIRTISYSPEHLVADRNHKWGISPFHFSKNLYRETVRSISSQRVRP